MMAAARKLIMNKRIATAYCMTCHRLFGKTFSVMAGQAHDEGRWFGPACAAFIDWLLNDPDHCANQLYYYRRSRRI